MKKSLLLLGVIAALAIGAPAYSQYIFFDVNGDTTCTSADALTSLTTSVDVWLDTNRNAAGTVTPCSDGVNINDFFLYDILVHSEGSGSLQYDGYTNKVPAFSMHDAFTVSGPDAGVGYNGPNYLAPGLYKLGTFAVTITGTPVLSFLYSNVGTGIPSPATGFASHCTATVHPYYVTLGIDFTDNCGTASPTPTESTTWGKIKQLYR
jgi:hypothetical protein